MTRHVVLALFLSACAGEVPGEIPVDTGEQLLRTKKLEDWCCTPDSCPAGENDSQCGTDGNIYTGCKEGQIKWWCPAGDDFDCGTCTRDPNY